MIGVQPLHRQYSILIKNLSLSSTHTCIKLRCVFFFEQTPSRYDFSADVVRFYCIIIAPVNIIYYICMDKNNKNKYMLVAPQQFYQCVSLCLYAGRQFLTLIVHDPSINKIIFIELCRVYI